MRMAVFAWIIALALIVCVACDLAGPDSVPVDPGTVVARVTDESGAPMRDVWVYVHDIPNRVGSTYTVGVPTNGSGTARIDSIPAGRRRVDVKPPAGYAPPDAVLLDVIEGQDVSVELTLKRNSAQ